MRLGLVGDVIMDEMGSMVGLQRVKILQKYPEKGTLSFLRELTSKNNY